MTSELAGALADLCLVGAVLSAAGLVTAIASLWAPDDDQPY